MSARTATLVDAIGSCARNIPARANVAGYLTGGGIAWKPSTWDRFKAARVPILQEPTMDQVLIRTPGLVLDIEAGALTFLQAVDITRQRAGLITTWYVAAGNLQAARDTLREHHLVAWLWVANWSLTRTEAEAMIGGDIVAVQYASPDGGINTSARIPGTLRAIKNANVDLSVASVRWLAQHTPHPARKPRRLPVPHRKTTGGTFGAAIATLAIVYASKHGVHLDTTDRTLITALGAFITAAVVPLGRPR